MGTVSFNQKTSSGYTYGSQYSYQYQYPVQQQIAFQPDDIYKYYNPPTYYPPKYYPPSGGGGTPPPPPGTSTPPATQPPSVTPPAPSGQSLQVALGSIPIAHDGDVISSIYHNALRDALLQIAGFLGDDATNQQVAINYLPAFLPDSGSDPWKLVDRTAVQDGTKHLLGWMPLELPDGITITGLAGFGSKGAPVPGMFELRLVRQSIADGTHTDLGKLDLKDQSGTFNKSITLTGNDLDRTVDNLSYEYVVVGEYTHGSVSGNVDAKLFGVQVRGLRW